MPYLGRPLATDKTTKTKKIDSIASAFNGAQTVFSLVSGGAAVYPASSHNLVVSINGVLQEPDVAYTINASTVTFTAAPATNATFFSVVNGEPNDLLLTPSVTTLTVGANVSMNTTTLLVGNSTANTRMTSTAFTVGANVSMNATAVLIGNSTVNTVMTATTLSIGNNTVNTVITATGLTIANTHGSSSNTTNLLENRGGQLFFGGRRVDLVNEYAAAAVYGYAMGGETGVTVATTDRITFSTSVTAASTVSNLSQSRGYMTGLSDCAVYGYVMAGWQTAATYVATTDRITFSTSVTAASTVSNLSVARYGAACVSDGSVYGYAMGGNSGAYVATTDRITFSTSVTAASTVSNVSVGRQYPGGVSDGSVYGYAMGGDNGAYLATTDRITFSTSVTAASTVSNLSLARRISGAGVSDGSVYGYAMGGHSGATVTTTDRITFSTSVTAASTVSNLSGIRVGPAGVSDGSIYGYAMGGNSGAYVATTDRITFSTSVTAASTVSNLSQARGYAAGLSDGAV